jgi:uncharacterized protein with HXXEE motif
MKFSRLQWLFPIAVTLHNAEEAIWMPGWAATHAPRLPVHPPGAVEIRIALIVLSVAAFVVTYFSARRGSQSLWAYLLFGSIVTVLLNVFVPHLPATLLFKSYTPGVATAVLVNLPVMSVLATQMVRGRWVCGWKAVSFGAGVPIFLGGAIIITWLADRVY